MEADGAEYIELFEDSCALLQNKMPHKNYIKVRDMLWIGLIAQLQERFRLSTEEARQTILEFGLR